MRDSPMNSPIHFNSKKPSNDRLIPRHYLMVSALAVLLLVILVKVLEDCLPPASPPYCANGLGYKPPSANDVMVRC